MRGFGCGQLEPFLSKQRERVEISGSLFIIKRISAHDRNTKLNLANAYQIKNEAID